MNSTDRERKSHLMKSEWMMFFVFLFLLASFCTFFVCSLFLISVLYFFYHFFNSLLLSTLPFRNRDCWVCSGPATLLSLIRLCDLTSITFSDVTHRHTAIISLYWNQRHRRERICFSHLFSLRVRTVWGVLKQPIAARNWIDRGNHLREKKRTWIKQP